MLRNVQPSKMWRHAKPGCAFPDRHVTLPGPGANFAVGWNWRSERSGYADALSPSQLHLRINQCKFTPKFAKYRTSIYCVVFCNVISYLNCTIVTGYAGIISLTHSLTHASAHSLTHSLTRTPHSLTHSLTHSNSLTLTRSLTHSLARIHSRTQSSRSARTTCSPRNFPERLKLFAPLFSPSFHLLL